MSHLEGGSPLHPVTAHLPYDAPRLEQIGGHAAEGKAPDTMEFNAYTGMGTVGLAGPS